MRKLSDISTAIVFKVIGKGADSSVDGIRIPSTLQFDAVILYCVAAEQLLYIYRYSHRMLQKYDFIFIFPTFLQSFNSGKLLMAFSFNLSTARVYFSVCFRPLWPSRLATVLMLAPLLRMLTTDMLVYASTLHPPSNRLTAALVSREVKDKVLLPFAGILGLADKRQQTVVQRY